MKSKTQRREEAAIRQTERANRTTRQQLELIKKRRGASKREVARLTKGVKLP